MTLVHGNLVDPKKINHRERTHLRCIHDHNFDHPTAEVMKLGMSEEDLFGKALE